MEKSSKKMLVRLILPILIISLVALPPYLLRTRTYPVAIVEGNSMFPTLRNGDLVIFSGTSDSGATIANRTIIVYQAGETGMPALDYLIRPVIIHRIIQTVTQSDGVAFYRTRGDNNHFNDPALVNQNGVLGVPYAVIPGVGAFLLFAKSPQGMVFTAALLSFVYLSRMDKKIVDDKKKKKLLSSFAKLAINGQLKGEQYERLRLAVEFSDELPLDSLTDPMAVSITDWVKNGGLKGRWREEEIACPDCSAPAFQFNASGGTYFLLCPNCVGGRAAGVASQPSRTIASPIPVPPTRQRSKAAGRPSLARAASPENFPKTALEEATQVKAEEPSQVSSALFRVGDSVPFVDGWREVIKVRNEGVNRYAYKLKGVRGWKDEIQLKVGDAPQSKKEVGDIVTHGDRQYVVKNKRFDIFEKKWKYTLAPAE